MGAYEFSRSTSVDADPAVVHGLIDDLHEWTSWSPWEGLDPDLERTYSGADAGVGAHYAWAGNRKAGEGTMEVTASSPEQIDVAVTFLKPFKSASDVTFTLEPADGGTEVTWAMKGEQHGVAAVFAKLVSIEKLVGKDLERGLEQLKQAAEKAAQE